MIQIKRIFHPVGQGAFYVERHPNFNVVYDCGTLFPSKRFYEKIKQAFCSDEEIDMLFISHLDWDHISGLDTLKKSVKKIKKVILPLLDNADKLLLLTSWKKSQVDQYGNLIVDPASFFGPETDVVFVEPDRNEQDELPLNESQELETINGIIKSRTVISHNGSNWVFIPYNYDKKNRSTQFNLNLKNQKIVISNLNGQSLLNILVDRKKKNKLKNCYDQLKGQGFGDINENSMVLYSGPCSACNLHLSTFDVYPPCHTFKTCAFYGNDSIIKNAGCIYMGDSDSNKFALNAIYKVVWPFVGTIQIPHHGSIYNFNMQNIFNLGVCFICPISFGESNSFGHPSSKVVADILGSNNFPVEITESANSLFVEIIRG
jgi:hypothetical protein